MSFTVPPNAVSTPAFSKTESMLTVDLLKKRYLFGIDLTDSQGNELPDETIQHFIDTAVSALEHRLDIVITQRDFVENHDYRQVDYTEYNFIQLKQRPAQEVTEIKAQFPNNRDLVKYPKEWYVLEKESSQVQLSPIEGSFNGLIITNGGSYIPLLFGTRSYWPHLFTVSYTAGFCHDQIPKIFIDMIGMEASIGLFEILGDIVIDPGTANQSVSLDGASVSKGTTASAMYHAFSARVESYRKKLEGYEEAVRKYYNAIPFIVG